MSQSRNRRLIVASSFFYKECVYLNEDRRILGWVANKELKSKVDKKNSKNAQLKRQIERNVNTAKLRAQKASEEQGQPQQSSDSPQTAFAMSSSAFPVDRDSYELKNT